jgi:arylsulfatase A-like enzyme
MNRARLAPTLALMAATLTATPAPAKPDVLVILADQWSPRHVSWDQPQVRTPELDRIAGEGMIFDACYTPSPLCVPARVSLVTGLYPHNHGHAVWGNPNQYHLPPAAAPMFRDIRRAGYTTAQIGKLHWFSGADWKHGFASLDDYHRAMGLDHVLDVSGPVDSATAKNAYAQHLRGLGMLDAVAADLRRRYLDWEYEPRASLVGPGDYHDSFVTGAAVDFIVRQPKEKPLCLVVSLHSPHPPLDAPGEFSRMFDPDKLTLPANVPESFRRGDRTLDHAAVRKLLANYLGKIALVDQCIGRLVGALRARGTWDGALVLFTADHGEMLGAHGALAKGRLFEESARVPLVIRWPGHVQAGRTAALAQMMDIYPTIVEAVGGEVTPGRFAKSLLPVATGRQASVRDLALSEIGKGAARNMMIRDARFKYWTDDRGECLFDLRDDPLEMHDLAGAPEHRGTLDRMRAHLLAHLRSTQVNLADGAKSKVKRLREAER